MRNRILCALAALALAASLALAESVMVGSTETIIVPGGKVVTVTADSASAGRVYLLAPAPGGGGSSASWSISASGSQTIGPYPSQQRLQFVPTAGSLAWSVADATFITSEQAPSPDLSAYAPLAGADFTGQVTVTDSAADVGSFIVTLTDTTDSSASTFYASASDAYADFGFSVSPSGSATASLNADDTGIQIVALTTITHGSAQYGQLTVSDANAQLYATDGVDEAVVWLDPANPATAIVTGASATSIQGCKNFGVQADMGNVSGNAAECDTAYDPTLHGWCFFNGTDFYLIADGTTMCTYSGG